MELQEKRAFRKQMLQQRGALSAEYRKEADEARNRRIRSEAWIREAEVFLFYVSYRSEADTRTLLAEALQTGKTVAVPKVDGDNMEFFRITDMAQLVVGYQGILEPDGSCERLDAELLSGALGETGAVDRKVLLFVPGCAFDETGGRMGYGGGFYDRFMEKYPDMVRVALAYDAQIVPEVPREVHDKQVNVIVTETRTIQAKERD